MLIGVEYLTGMEKVDVPIEQFMEVFFFSAQTITTLGYGRVAPVGIMVNVKENQLLQIEVKVSLSL